MPVDARDALIAALIGQVRRVVVDSAGVIVNMGRRQRLFTGALRDAILALQPWCMWTGWRDGYLTRLRPPTTATQ